MMSDLRIFILRTKNEKGVKVWIVFDKNQTLTGRRDESQDNVLFRWGKPVGRFNDVTRYTGVMSRAEAAATIADVQSQQN